VAAVREGAQIFQIHNFSNISFVFMCDTTLCSELIFEKFKSGHLTHSILVAFVREGTLVVQRRRARVMT